jgi:hypothetical protein
MFFGKYYDSRFIGFGVVSPGSSVAQVFTPRPLVGLHAFLTRE